MQKSLLFDKILLFFLALSTIGISAVVANKTLPIITSESEERLEIVEPKISGAIPNTTIKPTSVAATKTPTPSTRDNRCIVTVFGQKYDVTSLRNSHSGGDVFRCGTDMSSVYEGQHGTGIKLIQRYMLNSSGATPVQQNIPREEEEEDDD